MYAFFLLFYLPISTFLYVIPMVTVRAMVVTGEHGGALEVTSAMSGTPGYNNNNSSTAGGVGDTKLDLTPFTTAMDWHIRANKSSVLFTLYTLDCQYGEKIILGKSVVNKTCFNPNNDLEILVHGYTEVGHSMNSMVPIRLAFFKANRDVNILVADWSLHSVDSNYFNSAMHLDEVGIYLAMFLDYIRMTTTFRNMSRVHMIGFSLGAHVSGLAGRHIKHLTGQKIGRITGLDPAGPKFQAILAKERIRLDDAEFLDFIHGDTDTYGGNFQGHANFYPNGGKKQPGCGTILAAIVGCGHRKTPQWFAESIMYPRRFLACRCTDYDAFLRGDCSCVNRSEVALMGEFCNSKARGKYFLTVKQADYQYEIGIYPNLLSLGLSSSGTIQNHSAPHFPIEAFLPQIPSINFTAIMVNPDPDEIKSNQPSL